MELEKTFDDQILFTHAEANLLLTEIGAEFTLISALNGAPQYTAKLYTCCRLIPNRGRGRGGRGGGEDLKTMLYEIVSDDFYAAHLEAHNGDRVFFRAAAAARQVHFRFLPAEEENAPPPPII